MIDDHPSLPLFSCSAQLVVVFAVVLVVVLAEDEKDRLLYDQAMLLDPLRPALSITTVNNNSTEAEKTTLAMNVDVQQYFSPCDL